MTIVTSTLNSTSVKKCAPTAMRVAAVQTVKAAAIVSASGRHGRGTSNAGANIQAAVDTSPDMKEQLLSQAPNGFHQST